MKMINSLTTCGYTMKPISTWIALSTSKIFITGPSRTLQSYTSICYTVLRLPCAVSSCSIIGPYIFEDLWLLWMFGIEMLQKNYRYFRKWLWMPWFNKMDQLHIVHPWQMHAMFSDWISSKNGIPFFGLQDPCLTVCDFLLWDSLKSKVDFHQSADRRTESQDMQENLQHSYSNTPLDIAKCKSVGMSTQKRS